MDHFTIDLLARERIGTMQQEAKEARLARTKARGAQSEARRPMASLRRVVARIALAG